MIPDWYTCGGGCLNQDSSDLLAEKYLKKFRYPVAAIVLLRI
jgi:hypothetical protein